MSLRVRILVASIAAVLVLNATTTIYLHAALEKTLLQDAEAFLRAKTHALAALLEAEPNDLTSVRQEVEWQPPSIQYSHVYTRVLDATGTILLETRDSRDEWPMSAAAPNDVPRSVDAPSGSRLLELATRAGPRTVQVAIDLSRQYETLGSQRWILFLVAVVSVASLSFLAAAMSRLATTPIHHLVEETRSLRSGTPIELRPESYPSELQPLVRALKELHAELAEKIRSLSRFSESVAHELRNPINILIGEAELTLTRERTSAEYQDTLRSALEEYRDLSQLIDSLLFIARAENHAELIRRVPVEARDLVEEVLEFYRPLAEERAVSAFNDVPAGTRIMADPLLFRRALGNLVANAIQHGASPGEVHVVASSEESGGTAVRVTNRGPVLDDEALSKLFERFYRADPSRSKGSGNGLGLSIVKGIMTLHGGTATARPEAWRGMVFELSFPAS